MKKIFFIVLTLMCITIQVTYAADTKVSALPELAVTPDGADTLYIIDGTTSKKISVTNLLSFSVAGDFDHDDLANITGTVGQYNHPTDANMTVLGNTSNTNSGDEPDANLTTKGIVELATPAETVTGTDATRAVTPDGLTDKMAAPGAIGGTTPAAGTFTTVTATSGLSTGSGTSSGGAYFTMLEDTDNGTNFSGWGVYGNLATDTLYMFPLAAPTANQILQFAVPGNQTMSDGSTKSVSIGTWTSPSAETNALETTITGVADTEIFVGDGADSGAFVVVSGDIAIANTGATTIQPNSVDASMISDMYAYQEIPIAWMKDGSSAPDAIDDGTTRSPYAYRTFSNAADEDLNFVWVVPADLSGSVVQFRVYYLVTNATGPSAEGVAFGLSGVSLGDNDATNGAKGTVVVTADATITAVQHDILITPWSGDVTITNLAAGEVAEIALIRDVSDAADDYAQVVGVFMVQIRYVKNPAR